MYNRCFLSIILPSTGRPPRPPRPPQHRCPSDFTCLHCRSSVRCSSRVAENKLLTPWHTLASARCGSVDAAPSGPSAPERTNAVRPQGSTPGDGQASRPLPSPWPGISPHLPWQPRTYHRRACRYSLTLTVRHPRSTTHGRSHPPSVCAYLGPKYTSSAGRPWGGREATTAEPNRLPRNHSNHVRLRGSGPFDQRCADCPLGETRAAVCSNHRFHMCNQWSIMVAVTRLPGDLEPGLQLLA